MSDAELFIHELLSVYKFHLIVHYHGSLEPIQPAKYPNVGFVTWGDNVLLDQNASVKNHLELTMWDNQNRAIHPVFTGLPYVFATSDDRFLTSSVLESQRMGSAYFITSEEYRKRLTAALQIGGELRTDGLSLAQAARILDLGTLLGGTWISGFQPTGAPASGLFKLTSLFTTQIIGIGARLERGGTKKSFNPSVKGGVGNVPFSFTSVTTEASKQSYRFDVGLLRSYGLGEDVEALVIAIALWQLYSFLEKEPRLRSECWLDFDRIELVSPSHLKGKLDESPATLRKGIEPLIQSLIKKVYGKGGEVTHVRLSSSDLKKAEKANKAEAEREQSPDAEGESL